MVSNAKGGAEKAWHTFIMAIDKAIQRVPMAFKIHSIEQ